jgi:hypothetical protein
MNQKELYEWKKQIDFNSTYHETLVRLIGDAQKKGEKARNLTNKKKYENYVKESLAGSPFSSTFDYVMKLKLTN